MYGDYCQLHELAALTRNEQEVVRVQEPVGTYERKESSRKLSENRTEDSSAHSLLIRPTTLSRL